MDEYLPKKRDGDAEGIETAPVVIAPSRSKAGLVLVLGLIFVTLGLFLATLVDPLAKIAAGFAILLGLAGGGAAVGTRVPSSTHLAFDEGGLTHRHLWRDTHVAWDDIERIGVFSQAGSRMVVYDVPGDRGVMARMNRGVCGYSHAIPDTFGRSPEELAELLEAWRVAYARPELPAETSQD